MTRRALALAVGATVAAAAPAWAAPDPLRDRQWGNDAIHAGAALATSDGRGALVAVVDSGVDDSLPDFGGGVVRGVDLVDGDKDPDDENGHGTHVAGILGARAGNGIGIAGVAPAASILAIRVLDDVNRGTLAQIIEGIDAAIAARADVITLSLNPDESLLPFLLPDHDLTKAIERAAASGAVVVAAAGNDALPVCEQPPTRGRILCVGAVGRTGARAAFSSYGFRVDLVAPGVDIIGPVPGGGYEDASGTSEAVPFVAGVAARLVALGLRGAGAIDRILATAHDLGAPGVDATYGHGLVDAAAAVAGFPALPPLVSGSGITARSARTVGAARVRRHGLGVRCRVRVRARCSVHGRLDDGTIVLKGSRVLRAGRAATLHVPLTGAGRRLVRRGRALRVLLSVSAPGSGTAAGTVVIRP